MRKEKPTGKEIAEKAKKIKLDKEKFVHGKKNGKSVKFTGAELPTLNSEEELEEGQVIGVLENELEGDETGLPPGKYNLFLANVEGNWKVYAESGGEIKKEAARVKVEYHQWGKQKKEMPRFEPEGWCLFNVCLVSVWIFCLVSVGVLCF